MQVLLYFNEHVHVYLMYSCGLCTNAHTEDSTINSLDRWSFMSSITEICMYSYAFIPSPTIYVFHSMCGKYT